MKFEPSWDKATLVRVPFEGSSFDSRSYLPHVDGEPVTRLVSWDGRDIELPRSYSATYSRQTDTYMLRIRKGNYQVMEIIYGQWSYDGMLFAIENAERKLWKLVGQEEMKIRDINR